VQRRRKANKVSDITFKPIHFFLFFWFFFMVIPTIHILRYFGKAGLVLNTKTFWLLAAWLLWLMASGITTWLVVKSIKTYARLSGTEEQTVHNTCPYCGYDLRASEIYCRECGRKTDRPNS
jgi:hypothetical protein